METENLEDEWCESGLVLRVYGSKIIVFENPKTNHYIVTNKKKDKEILGQIALMDEKGYGKKWWFYPVPHHSSTGVFLSVDCLREIVGFMETLV